MSLKNLEKIGMKIIQTKNFKKELLEISEFIYNNSTQASKNLVKIYIMNLHQMKIMKL